MALKIFNIHELLFLLNTITEGSSFDKEQNLEQQQQQQQKDAADMVLYHHC